jgi:hypothetical protein
MAIFTSLLSFVSPLHCDAPYPWQIGFQDGATPTFEGIVELHDTIFFYLVVISFLVFWMLAVIMIKFSSNKVGIVHKYHNHGTLIELIWTITPALILIAIAFPSFKLLYLMDSPEVLNICNCTITQLAMLPIKMNSKPVPVKSLKSNCTALVPYGQVGPTMGINYNSTVRSMTAFPKPVISQLVGHILGDGSLAMSHTSVFQQLAHYCVRYPLLGLSRGKYFFLQVPTRSFPILRSLYELFYPIVGGKRVKLITLGVLAYLDDIALAY